MATEKSKYHATPNGGVKSVARFKNERGEPADEADATQVEITEYDGNDEEVYRTVMVKGKT